MTEILLCYIVSLAVIAAGFAAFLVYFKRGAKIRLQAGSVLIGILSAVLYFALLVLLFMATFSTDYYYNTVFFRSLVGFVFIALLCLARLLLTRSVFFNRDKDSQGLSFCFGFGAAPAVLLAVYLLIITLVVAFNGLFNGPCVVEEGEYLSFADNTIISVFRPAAGHISFALLAVFYAVITTASGFVLRKFSARPYGIFVTVLWVVLMILLETVAVFPVPFISMFQLDHWQLPLIGAIAAAGSATLARFMPKEKKPADYTKQFE